MLLSQPRSHLSHLHRGLIHPSGQLPIVSYDVGVDWTPDRRPVDAAQNAAKLIASEANGSEIYIPLSGGIDSECVARSFLLAKIKFNPLIMMYSNGFNDFDTRWAFDFCDKMSLNPTILNLDLEEFYQSDFHLECARSYGCRSPQFATHLWMADQVKGSVIFPHCIPPLFKSKSDKLFFAFPPDLHLSYDRYFDFKEKPGVGMFFLYTADLIYSFFQLPLYQEMIFNSAQFNRFYSNHSYLLKFELYRAGGFDIKIRPNKATGFELFRKFLNEKYNWTGSDYFDHHFRKPMEAIVQDPLTMAVGNIDLERLYGIWSKT